MGGCIPQLQPLPVATHAEIFIVAEEPLSVVAVVSLRTPPTGWTGGCGGVALLRRKGQHSFDPVDHSSRGGVKEVLGDIFDLESPLVEVCLLYTSPSPRDA